MLARTVILVLLLQLTDSVFISRRRRTPRPPRVDCSLTSWKAVSRCSAECGTSGKQEQGRKIVEEGRNGGIECSNYELKRTVSCNTICYNEGKIDDQTNSCKCPDNWQGECCGTDVDECVPGHPCEQLCVNDPGSFHCDCLKNYTLATDNVSCKDEKECQKDPPPCDHRCEEKGEGQGYRCYCNSGYKLASDNKACQDINECETGSQCEYRCKNIPGDYECICRKGYFRNTDNKTCTDINECFQNNGGCRQQCINTVGGFKCNCTTGYKLSDNSYDCEDINECEVYVEYNICEQRCINILGSYKCDCIPPYLLNSDARTCYCGSTDSELCKKIKDQAEANKKKSGDGSDAVYNIVIVVLICICVSLIIGLFVVCGRKGYHRMYPPKLPPLSTMPRFTNSVFNPNLAVNTGGDGDDDSGSGIYADPEEFAHSPDYMDMSHDPLGKDPEFCTEDPEQVYENEGDRPVANDYTDLPGAQTLERHSRIQETEYENNPLYELGDQI